MVNREHALRASLLLLPDVFREIDLYYSVASLSYMGDPRMFIGENPKKVLNLVDPVVPHYRALYMPKLQKMVDKKGVAVKMVPPSSDFKHANGSTLFMHENTPAQRWQLSEGLPLRMRRLLTTPGKAKHLRAAPPTRPAIRAALSSIVAHAATPQSMKGLLTVGAFKVTSYLFSKMKKRVLAPTSSLAMGIGKKGSTSSSTSGSAGGMGVSKV